MYGQAGAESMMLRRHVFVCLLAVALVAGLGRADAVERRGIESTVRGEVISLENAGVRIQRTQGAELLIPWDRVRRIDTVRQFADLEDRMKTATELWRARTRVERGDTALAEPLLDRLFEAFKGQTNVTALVAAEGVLRCRLDRGAHESALIPVLEVARLKRAGVDSVSYSSLQPVIDEDTLLCMGIAPVWIVSPSLASLHRELESYDAEGDPVISAMARLYRHSVGRALGRSETETPSTLPDHDGVELLSMLLACESSAVGSRRSAITRVKRRIPNLPEWARAWSRYQLGVAMLTDELPEMRQRGLLQLAHVPARYGASQAYLAGMALNQMSEELRRQGDDEGAASVLAEFARRYPDHPLLLTQLSAKN